MVSNNNVMTILLLGLLAFLARPPQQEAAIENVDSAVATANVQSKVAPRYPPLAQAARVQGTVLLQLAMNKEGTVSDLKVVRGHPLLNEAAVEAVRQWQYKPHEVNGQPVEFITTVTIGFALVFPPAIPSGTAAITGRVVRADGTPAAGVSVDVALPTENSPAPITGTSFTEVPGGYLLESRGPGLLRPGWPTDDSGQYRIERLGPGTYKVFARENERIVYFPGTSAAEAVSLTIESNELVLVGIDFQIP